MEPSKKVTGDVVRRGVVAVVGRCSLSSSSPNESAQDSVKSTPNSIESTRLEQCKDRVLLRRQYSP
jgi:hypothetical protein